MTLRTFYKSVAGIALTLIPATAALAQDAPEQPTWDVSDIARIDTQLGENGSCKQRLPNAIINVKNSDLHVSGAVKVDNLGAANGCFGEHDARLFFLNATYKGMQDNGTTIKAGVLTPFDLTKYPLNKGFTSVVLGDNHQLYGGILGVKVDQNLISTESTTLDINAGGGTKPDWLERFGAPSDSVVFAGVSGSHKLSNNLTASGAVEYVSFDQGADIFGYGALKYDGENIDLNLYAETTQGERQTPAGMVKTDKYSVMGSMITPLTAQTDWQFAAGLIDGDAAIETSLYQNLSGISKGLRGTIGAGHNFDTNAQTVRVGLIHSF